jgi:RHH-type proline utilization regulon transcriptional repressor/proline dehydrogenase/delta 1-pyrroline-5-carboxylate dehydrogenase
MSESKLVHKAQALLEQLKGRSLDPLERRNRAIELAAWLVTESRNRLTSTERNVQAQLAAMMNDPHGKDFTVAMTDQCFRAHRRRRVADQLVYLLKRYGVPKFLPFETRWKLGLFRFLGRFLPQLLVPAARFTLKRETARVIVPGESGRLTKHVQKRRKDGVRINLNHIGEAILGEEEALRRLNVYLESLADPEIEYVSVKVSSICSQINLLAWDETVAVLKERIRKLYRAAAQNPYQTPDGRLVPKFVNLDMEEYRDLHITVETFRSLLEEAEFQDLYAGIVLQAYLPDSYLVQQELTVWAMKRVANGGSPIKIRLVKGANLAMERVESSDGDWPQAPYPTKVEVDANYKRMIEYASVPEHAKAAHVAVGSHNLFDVAYAMILRAERGVDAELSFEMLEGMADHMRRVVQEVGHDILLYCPAAKEDDFVSAISYLIRRLDENTAEENFLRHSFGLEPGTMEWEQQLQQFCEACARIESVSSAPRRQQNRHHVPDVQRHERFENEAHTDWALAHNQRWVRSVIEAHKDLHYGEVPLVIAGEELRHADTERAGKDPSRPGATPYRYSVANEEDIQRALHCAEAQKALWQQRSVEERLESAALLAQILRSRRGELVAAMITDGGKTFTEADNELNEAVDFVEYYSRSLLDFSQMEDLEWQAKGTVLVAPPWNFPCAIPLGGVIAALLCGNTVIFKPAQETVLVAYKVAQACWDAGIPKEVLQFLVCEDEPHGSTLVRDARIDAVILTGATATAKHFLKLRSDIDLMAETGGKNAIIVTAMADRDLAVKEIVQSAFGHAGQKCSAASLAIIEAEVYDDPRFLHQLRDAAASWEVGSAWELKTKVNPLIHAPSDTLLRGLTELEEGESWLLRPRQVAGQANLWSPGIKLGVKPGNFCFETELFGPVLSLVRARDLQDAIRMVNSSHYGLTSGLQSLDPREQDIWKEKIDAGNCYINRGITGAIVQRQAFGGIKDSAFGRGFKAGGPNYLLQLMHSRELAHPAVVSETLAQQRPLIERFEEMGLDYSAGSRLGAALGSYAYYWEHYFSRPYDASKLIGQDNHLLYRPREDLVIRIQPEDSLQDFACLLAAMTTVGARMEVSVDADVLAQLPKVMSIQGLPGLSVLVEGEEDFVASCVGRPGRRVRFLRPARHKTLEALGKAGVQSFVVPVHSHGRLELPNFLREQSLSVNYHRYGNLGDREMEERCPLPEPSRT